MKMTFQNYTYERLDMTVFSAAFNTALSTFQRAATFVEQDAALEGIVVLRTEFESMATICSIRHTIDTKDAFYEDENDYCDEISPNYQELINVFYKSLLGATFRTELEKKWGKQLFIIAELALKTFEPSILTDLQEENKLTSEYTKLNSSSRIEFRGEVYNATGMVPFEQSDDRTTRREAAEAKWNWYLCNGETYDRIFDDLTRVRTRIAHTLGYKNFVELAYVRMGRSDYNAADVARYRQQIYEYIVPIATKLRERQQRRLGYDTLYYYDEVYEFATGNPKPKGSPDWIVKNAETMYRELAPETDEFFQYMQDYNLMDLQNRDTKAPGGYCTVISNHKSPFIFANFNGTTHDVEVLTHEAGHAFQVFQSRNFGVPEYHFPTYEACEIHSMSMEFLTWPWMKLFFEEDTEKFMFAHLSGALLFLPYGVAVDEFQHWIYENATASPQERCDAWRKMEKKYLPHRNYEGNEHLQAGGWWHKQSHIYQNPFYYIDYTLAQICAFQFWKRSRENREQAWADYLRLCKAGGSMSFLELVNLAGLRSPFEDGCLKSVVGDIEAWIDSIDDSKF
ncbi:MAG: hypothetical protein RI894_119 [Bacteroidota bacterium]|jgi:M3 family oligoendopeptidase